MGVGVKKTDNSAREGVLRHLASCHAKKTKKGGAGVFGAQDTSSTPAEQVQHTGRGTKWFLALQTMHSSKSASLTRLCILWAKPKEINTERDNHK
jgi:hypothetical protein